MTRRSARSRARRLPVALDAGPFGSLTRRLPEHAFVMHLRDEVPSGAGRAAIGGRVEHVVSGRSVEFASLAELGRFMRRTAARADRGSAVVPLAPSPSPTGHPRGPETT